MSQLARFAAGAAANGLLVGQLVFSLAFISSCELPNWISGPRQANACLERWMTVSALFFPSSIAGGKLTTALLPNSKRGLFG
jgi:hypothetical protein